LTRWQRAGLGWPAWGGFFNPYAYPGATPYAAPTITRQQEIDSLKSQAEYLEEQLENIRARLKELEGEAK